ncbi:Transposase (or an inactivated derivative) [Nitrosomonas cryotolerans]|nr:Transposase (or an inactivated derivative) [Nitrosomonas cryotolerans]
MMLERGFEVDHTTLYRWVQHYAPEIERRLRWHYKAGIARSWRVDETYVKVKEEWAYLYRTVDKCGHTIDFYLSSTRSAKTAKRFLGKAFKPIKPWAHPKTINTDKAPTFGPAITELQEEEKCPKYTIHRQVKYLNNIVEADHGKLKQLINPVRGFKSLKTAYAMIKGFEIMRMFKEGQMDNWKYRQGFTG